MSRGGGRAGLGPCAGRAPALRSVRAEGSVEVVQRASRAGGRAAR
ncbi:hypothetical protein SFR_4830 [Streptomyces sp. FR-008]|nr:hypothetical protein SFR_4830 [Streptomyces sp. FR-008]